MEKKEVDIWVEGLIRAGETCPYSDKCPFKELASNGKGCPISDGKTQAINFSCGAARLFRLTNKE